MTALETKLRLSELRQAVGNALRSRKLPSWLLLTAEGCYGELGRLAVAVVHPRDPAVIAAAARAETILEICGLAPPTGQHAIVHASPDARRQPTPRRERGAGRTILLVEDDLDVRVSVRESLQDEGYRVIALRDGMEAMSTLEHLEPSLLLVDLMMPRLNGWELVRRIRADARLASIPVCVISAFPDLRTPANVAAALKKPIDLDALLATVDQYARMPATE